MDDQKNDYNHNVKYSNDPQYTEHPLQNNDSLQHNLLLEQHMVVGQQTIPILSGQPTLNDHGSNMGLTLTDYYGTAPASDYDMVQPNLSNQPHTIIYKNNPSSQLLPTSFSTQSDYMMNGPIIDNTLLYDSFYLPSQYKDSYPPHSITTSFNPSNIPPREENAVFSELISMATVNNNDLFKQQMITHPNITWNSSAYKTPPYPISTPYKDDIPKNKGSSLKADPAELIDPSESVYELIIVQQPLRGRMCGFGDKDRRPISPAPILQLIVSDKYKQVKDPETLDTTFLVVMCNSLQKTNNVQPNESQYTPISQVVTFSSSENKATENDPSTDMKNLVGCCVASATKLYDLKGNLGIFFVFQDISLRTEGQFQLEFSLMDIASPYSRTVNTTSVSHILKTAVTDPFFVYTAKKFPGVVQSTALSRCFASQGLKMPIRKDKNDPTHKRHKTAAQKDIEIQGDENSEIKEV